MPSAIAGAGVPALHVVTDDVVLSRPAFLEMARAVLQEGGARVALHVRGPGTRGDAMFHVVSALAPLARTTGALLVVNDRVDVALCAGARAVHLGLRSLAPAQARRVLGASARVGLSTHDPAEAAAARRNGVDWIFAGTVWETPSHPGRAGGGIESLRQAVESAGPVPVLAIGGVTVERAAAARTAGAHGAAVIRGVWDTPDPTRAVTDYLQVLAPGSAKKTTTG